MFAVFGLRRSSLETEHIGTRVSLRHRQTDELLRAQNLRHNARLEFWRTEVEHGGQADNAPGLKTVTVATRPTTGDFLVDDELVEVIKL